MMTYLKVSILIIVFTAGYADSLRFRQTWYVPRGTYGTSSNVKGFDVNRDKINELIFTSIWRSDSSALLYYSCFPYDQYWLSDSICGPFKWRPSFSNIGDVDADSLIDVVVSGIDQLDDCYTGIYEATDLHSFPKKLVWRAIHSVGLCGQDHHITDLDRDGKKEITCLQYVYPKVYECLSLIHI